MTTTAQPESNIVSFGPTEAPDYRRVPINFSYLRDDRLVTDRFQIIAKSMDIGAANRVMRLLDGGGAAASDAQALLAMIRLIAKFMDDKDGTSATWSAESAAVAPKKTDPADAPRRFRGPDGKLHPWDKAEAFLRPESGSSRRRWLHLMNEDDDAAVDLDALTQLLQFLMELAGKDRGHA